MGKLQIVHTSRVKIHECRPPRLHFLAPWRKRWGAGSRYDCSCERTWFLATQTKECWCGTWEELGWRSIGDFIPFQLHICPDDEE